jgi:hypothetical protein
MSEPTPASALPSMRPAGRTTSPRAGSDTAAGVPPRRPEGLPPPPARPSPQGRLVALGVAEPTARSLIEQHGEARVVDALDAVDTLGDGEVRRRAGWVVSAIRQGWDLEGLLAERRQLEARYARWEAERAERDRAAARWRAQGSVVAAWRAALSGALDDRQFADAVERVTTPVAGLGRRSLPIVRAQLLAWAVTVHAAASDRPLSEVLAEDLVGRDRNVAAPSLEGPLPPVPPLPGHVGEPEDNLTDRLTRLLARRPDLTTPGTPTHERAEVARSRALGEGVGHVR